MWILFFGLIYLSIGYSPHSEIKSTAHKRNKKKIIINISRILFKVSIKLYVSDRIYELFESIKNRLIFILSDRAASFSFMDYFMDYLFHPNFIYTHITEIVYARKQYLSAKTTKHVFRNVVPINLICPSNSFFKVS
jgi:hypothetical protein